MRVPTPLLLLGLAAVLAGCGSVSAGGNHGGHTEVAAASPHDADPGVASLQTDGSSAPLTALTRRTAGPVTMRLFTRSVPSSSVACTVGGSCVPAWCQPTMQLVTELSTPAIAAVLESPVIGLDASSPLSVLGTASSRDASGTQVPSTVGTAEGSPVEVAVARVDSSVATVTMKTGDGSDSAAPVQGLVALAVPGSSTTGALAALDAQGRELAHANLPGPPTSDTTACQPATSPPVAAQQPPPAPLPSPGRQPADPTSAATAVQAAFHTAFTAVKGQPPYASLATVQDGQDLHGALDQLRSNFAAAAASASVTTGQVVFTSPTSAATEFTLSYTDGVPYGPHLGTAVLENGSWLVSRDTYCAVLAFGNAPCPAS